MSRSGMSMRTTAYELGRATQGSRPCHGRAGDISRCASCTERRDGPARSCGSHAARPSARDCTTAPPVRCSQPAGIISSLQLTSGQLGMKYPGRSGTAREAVGSLTCSRVPSGCKVQRHTSGGTSPVILLARKPPYTVGLRLTAEVPKPEQRPARSPTDPWRLGSKAWMPPWNLAGGFGPRSFQE